MSRIRRARKEEAPHLSALAMRSKAYWGYDPNFMESCRQELTVTTEEIADGLTFVIEDDDHLIRGFYALEPLAEHRMELNFLFVEPDSIGRGYGRALIQHAIACANAHNVAILEIAGDPNARSFYEAAGARAVGVRPSASIPGRLLPLFEIEVKAAPRAD